MSTLKQKADYILGGLKDFGNMPILALIFSSGLVLAGLNFWLFHPNAEYIEQRFTQTTFEKILLTDTTKVSAMPTYKSVKDSTGKEIVVEIPPVKPELKYEYVPVKRGIGYWSIMALLFILNTLGLVQGSINIEFRMNNKKTTTTTPGGTTTVDPFTPEEKVVLSWINYILWGGYSFVVFLTLGGFLKDMSNNPDFDLTIEIPSFFFQVVCMIIGIGLDHVLGYLASMQYEKWKKASKELDYKTDIDKKAYRKDYENLEARYPSLLKDLDDFGDLDKQKLVFTNNTAGIKDKLKNFVKEADKFMLTHAGIIENHHKTEVSKWRSDIESKRNVLNSK